MRPYLRALLTAAIVLAAAPAFAREGGRCNYCGCHGPRLSRTGRPLRRQGQSRPRLRLPALVEVQIRGALSQLGRRRGLPRRLWPQKSPYNCFYDC